MLIWDVPQMTNPYPLKTVDERVSFLLLLRKSPGLDFLGSVQDSAMSRRKIIPQLELFSLSSLKGIAYSKQRRINAQITHYQEMKPN